MSDVFISYQHEDREFVDILNSDLQKAGFFTWYDKRISPGSKWDTTIVDNLLQCHCFIAVISKAALQSDWVTFEWALGARSDKEMIVLIKDPDQVRPEDLPDFLKRIQILQWREPSSSDEVIKALATMNLPPRLWSELSTVGLDICLPKEKFKKPNDKAVADIEGVNLRSINVALDLQQQLFERFSPLTYKGDPIRIRFLSDNEVALRPNRNHLILGGPGGMPFVHSLLMKWAGLNREQELKSGYRFVTDPKRYFIPGPFLRPANLKGTFSRRVGQIGIEYVQARSVVQFFDYIEASTAVAGRNYVIIYTGNLDNTANETNKVIIVAAFNRHAFDGAIAFLLNRDISNPWFAQARRCGTYTETLVEFEVNIGQPLTLQRVHEPKQLGQ
jgi:hypothetical protein